MANQEQKGDPRASLFAVLSEFDVGNDFLVPEDFAFQGFDMAVLVKSYLAKVHYETKNPGEKTQFRKEVADALWLLLHRGSLIEKIKARTSLSGRERIGQIVTRLFITTVERTKGNPIAPDVMTLPRLGLVFAQQVMVSYSLWGARKIVGTEDFTKAPYYYMGWASICPGDRLFDDVFKLHCDWAKEASKILRPNLSAKEYEALDIIQMNIIKAQRASTFFTEEDKLTFHRPFVASHPGALSAAQETAIKGKQVVVKQAAPAKSTPAP